MKRFIGNEGWLHAWLLPLIYLPSFVVVLGTWWPHYLLCNWKQSMELVKKKYMYNKYKKLVANDMYSVIANINGIYLTGLFSADHI